MRYNFTHLAKRLAQPTLKQRIMSALFPSRSPLDEMLRAAGFMMEATYGYKGGYPGGTNTGIPSVPGSFNIAEIKLNFATIAAARSAAGQAAIGAADVLELFDVPIGTWVVAAFAQVTTAEGGAATGDLGDGATAAGYISNLDLNALGWGSSLITTTYSLATAGGKVYTAADTVDMVVDSASVDVAVVRFVLATVDLRSYRS